MEYAGDLVDGAPDGAPGLRGMSIAEALVRKSVDENSTEELLSMIQGRTRPPYLGAQGVYLLCGADTHLSAAYSGGVMGQYEHSWSPYDGL